MERRICRTDRKRVKAKRNKIALLCAICMVILIAFVSNGFAFSSGAVDLTSFKYYTEIRVQRDMTLFDIAQCYITDEYESHEAYIREVKEINSIHGNLIYYGQYLTVPYYSPEIK